MDEHTILAFETRAAQAEQRLSALESKLAAGVQTSVEAACTGAAQFNSSSTPPPPPRLRCPPACRAAGAAATASTSSGGAVDTSRYVAELQALRAVLVSAREEQEALEKRVGEVSCSLPGAPWQECVLLLVERRLPRCRTPLPLISAVPLCTLLQLEVENSKLKYQCLHLKRAVTEGDEKLAAALQSKAA